MRYRHYTRPHRQSFLIDTLQFSSGAQLRINLRTGARYVDNKPMSPVRGKTAVFHTGGNYYMDIPITQSHRITIRIHFPGFTTVSDLIDAILLETQKPVPKAECAKIKRSFPHLKFSKYSELMPEIYPVVTW